MQQLSVNVSSEIEMLRLSLEKDVSGWDAFLGVCSPQWLVCRGGAENHGENVLALCCRLRSLGAKSGAMS